MATAQHIALFGATGTAGRAVAQALLRDGHKVTCFARAATNIPGCDTALLDVSDPAALNTAFRQGQFDAVVSCLASRTGTPADAWAIDHQANLNILHAARLGGVDAFVHLSAICVQKPMLAFQHAKLAFEDALIRSGLTYTIVRPTAFFKSLSGQVARVLAGKPFMVFGDGRLTACKPISDADLARFMARCLSDSAMQNKVLPIGGPGPALQPLDQGAMLFDLLNRPARYRHVPVGLLDGISTGLRVGGKFLPRLAEKAELARIGRYYATESMLVWDADRGRYDADATPETGTETLREHYAKLLSGAETHDRSEHSVF